MEDEINKLLIKYESKLKAIGELKNSSNTIYSATLDGEQLVYEEIVKDLQTLLYCKI